jgi:Flp pilus assembly protein TadD
MYEQARTEFQKAQQLSPGNSTIMESIAEIDALTGRKNEADRALDHLTQLSKTEFVSPYAIAELSLVLGERDQALEWMEKAYQQRDNNLIYVNSDPSWATIRSDPRFQVLVARIGFPKH